MNVVLGPLRKSDKCDYRETDKALPLLALREGEKMDLENGRGGAGVTFHPARRDVSQVERMPQGTTTRRERQGFYV